MPTQNTLDQFIARVVSGAHAVAIKEFYTPNATMQENQLEPRVGRDVLVAHEKAALAKAGRWCQPASHPFSSTATMW